MKHKLIKPISDLEKTLIEEGTLDFEFVRWSSPHGFAVCRDDTGALWHLHPEALDPQPRPRIPDTLTGKVG